MGVSFFMSYLFLMLLGVGQVPDKLTAEFHPDFRAPDLIGSVMRPIGPGLHQDDQGVRITLPAGKGKLRPTGLMTSTAIRGDFEATLTYEILQADRPRTGYGVGVSLYAAIDPNNYSGVSLARRLVPDGTTQFVSNRMQPVAPRDWVRHVPSVADKGKLRIRRVGAVVQFLFHEEPAPDFVLLNEVNFGADDVRLIQVGANAGNSDAGLDVRLLDFTLLARELPDLTAPPAPAAPAALAEDAQPPRSRRPWLMLLSLTLLFLAGGTAAWWFSRRRSQPRQ
jgi:hypothetical protein